MTDIRTEDLLESCVEELLPVSPECIDILVILPPHLNHSFRIARGESVLHHVPAPPVPGECLLPLAFRPEYIAVDEAPSFVERCMDTANHRSPVPVWEMMQTEGCDHEIKLLIRPHIPEIPFD